MRVNWIIMALTVPILGCAQPGEVRTLADQTAGLIKETDNGVPAAQKAFAAQRVAVKQRTRWELDDASFLQLELAEIEERWSFTPWRKEDAALLVRVRAPEVVAVALAPASAAPRVQPPSRKTLDRFLKNMAGGAAWTLDELLAFANTVNQALSDVNAEAGAEASTTATKTAPSGN
jgi:hypothetical protein